MSFNDRERDFEARFAHDQELRFRIEARRNKLLGLWAAERMGRSGAEAERYAQEMIRASFEGPGDRDVFTRLRKDFDAAGVDKSDHQIRRCMDEFLAKAEEQVMGA